ncbi:MAG: MBL fold metallo-hydrolase [Candidatus Saccharibacteria bacterium]|nr:MAG: MBL fold metallo-hydrolase [Candidatus Saccharibacteria bacterium]
MKLTKYEHACFTLEKDNQVIVVDPGAFATDFIAPEHVVAIIVTHDHFDHFDPELVASIINENPDAIIYAPATVTAKIETFQAVSITEDTTENVGPFTMRFLAGKHSLLHPSIPVTDNLSVLINDLLFYPGDSFTVPPFSVDTLALPASAPWLKVGEAMDYLAEVRPRFAFPTHDAILSAEGKEVTDDHINWMAKECGVDYHRIESTEEI